MGTTPVFALPYVEPAAIVHDYPAADKAQAQAVEAALLGGPKAAWGWAKQLSAQSVADSGVGALMSGLTLDSSSTNVTLVSGNALRAPSAGIYHIGASVAWAGSNVGGRVMYLNLNGVQVIRFVGIASTAGTSIVGSFVCPMAAGDLATVTLWQSSGAALATSPQINGCGFTLTRL